MTCSTSVRERRPLDQLHDERDAARAFSQAVHLRDVQMVERGKGSSFAIIACQPFGILRDRLRQDFDRHTATEFAIRRPIQVPPLVVMQGIIDGRVSEDAEGLNVKRRSPLTG